jgi:Protein of unknown function (DUF3592)
VPRRKANKFAAFANSPRVAAGFLALVALGCGVGTCVAFSDATALRDHGQRVVGDVVEVHDGRSGYVVVRFRDLEGRSVVADVGNYRWDPRPQVGDHPEVLYDPADPPGNVVDVRSGPDFYPVWALAIGCVVAAALVRPTWSGRLNWSRLGR